MYWQAGSLNQLFVQILTDPMPPPSERGSTLGPAFDAWFSRACNRDPAQRFSTADQQVEALAEALGLPEQPRMSEPSLRVPTPRVSGVSTGTLSLSASSTDLRTAKRKRGRVWLAGVGIAGAVAAVCLLALLARGGAHGQDIHTSAANPGLSMITAQAPTAPSPSPQASISELVPASPSADSTDAAVHSTSSVSSAAAPKPAGPAWLQKRSVSAPAAKAEAQKARDPLEGAY
jgi:hypothetical protein